MQPLANQRLRIYTTEFTQPWDEFTQLLVLDLAGSQLTNPDFMRLEKLADLRILNLSGSNISDHSIIHLFSLSSLTVLYLENTAVSARGLARLRKRLPACGIVA